ncbi:protein FAM83E-like [Scyliorhinus torazame]|uniref:protein FAM83E-like n=1 Tax=Scyliorhinus torazame TaxID=75743 RepID=UPI003B5ABA80
MDIFTDVDIFFDLLDGASLRRVPAYILLDQGNLSQFIAMAQDSGTNLQLLDNVSVRILNGCSFCSRNGTKVTGDVKERFLLVDGETVITGSYSFTWSDARLDRNLVTLLTGQVVDAFDREFRTLYASSRPLQQSDFAPPTPQPALLNGYAPSPSPSPAPARLQPLLPPAKATLHNRVVARRTISPLPPAAQLADLSRSGSRPNVRQTITMWRGSRAAQGAEAAQALSDIMRRARQASGGLSALAPKASKSMWDLSALSQLSNSSFGSNSALDHLELGEDARSRLVKSQVTPAATLMKHRDALKEDEAPANSRSPRTFYPSRPLALAMPGNLRRAAPRPWAGPVNSGGKSKAGSCKPAEV